MKTKITYGLLIALVGIAVKLVAFLLGFETDKIGTTSATIFGTVLGLGSLVLIFILVWFGVRAVRDEKPDKCLTFGQGFGAGIIIVLVAAVIGAIYTFIHYSFINPDFAEYTIALTRQKLAETGARSEQAAEMAEKVMHIMLHPAVMALSDFIGRIFWGAIFSLIAAAIVKRAPQSAAQVPPPL